MTLYITPERCALFLGRSKSISPFRFQLCHDAEFVIEDHYRALRRTHYGEFPRRGHQEGPLHGAMRPH